MNILEVDPYTLKNLILQNLNYEKDDIIFASGSIIEKLGNMYSDIDLFILNDRMNQIYELKINRIQSIKIDLETWNLSFLKKIISNVNNFDVNNLESNFFEEMVLDNISLEQQLSILHRLLVGVSILNETEFKKLISSLNQNNYFILLSRLHSNNVDNSYEDILGNFEMGNYKNSILISINTLPEAIMAYLSSKKISIDRQKWALKKLELLSQKDLEAKEMYDRICSLLFTSNNFDLRSNSKQYIKIINELLKLSFN